MNFIVQNKKTNLSGFFAALSLYSPSINYCLSGHLGYAFTDVVTGALMFLFAFLALAFGLMRNVIGHALKYKQLFTIGLLIAISVIWLGNYLMEYHSGSLLSGYDVKRPFFYIYGVLCFGFIGVFASADPYNFLREFFKTSVLAAAIVCVLYLALFDSSVELARIGGDAGLIVGILIAQGGASLIAGYRMNFFKGRALVYLMPMFFVGIVMSGTRSALIALLFCVIILALSELIKLNGRYIVRLALLIVLPVVFFVFVVNTVPEQFIRRISNFNLEGSENRGELLILAFEVFGGNVLGKVTGFSEYFPAGIEYSHNTAVQILLEIGVVGLVFFLLLIITAALCLINIGKARCETVLNKGVFYYALSVFLVSLSAGSAYDPQYWMALTLFSSLGVGSIGVKVVNGRNRTKSRMLNTLI